MNILIIFPLIASFLLVVGVMPFWIRKAEQIGLVWKDMNKINGRKIAGSGGLVVLFAFLVSALLYVSILTFYYQNKENLIEVLALLLLAVVVGGIGFIDDLMGWQRGGLSRRSRLIIVLLAAVPLMAIKAGESRVGIPFFGVVELDIIYALILVPLGIAGATTTFNFLAGFNGLEAGLGVILLLGGVIVSFITGSSWLAIILLCMVFALMAFLKFNFYPAKVFPGDVLTYPVGALFAGAAILGNFERIALFFFIPYMLEVILKLRGKLEKASFGKPTKEGVLELEYGKIYGLTHLALFLLNKAGIKATEKNVVYLIWGFQGLLILLGLLIFSGGLYAKA